MSPVHRDLENSGGALRHPLDALLPAFPPPEVSALLPDGFEAGSITIAESKPCAAGYGVPLPSVVFCSVTASITPAFLPKRANCVGEIGSSVKRDGSRSSLRLGNVATTHFTPPLVRTTFTESGRVLTAVRGISMYRRMLPLLSAGPMVGRRNTKDVATDEPSEEATSFAPHRVRADSLSVPRDQPSHSI
jgi:hypothetical protein